MRAVGYRSERPIALCQALDVCLPGRQQPIKPRVAEHHQLSRDTHVVDDIVCQRSHVVQAIGRTSSDPNDPHRPYSAAGRFQRRDPEGCWPLLLAYLWLYRLPLHRFDRLR